MLSFANDQPITNTNLTNTATNERWRGTLLFHNPGMYFKALYYGANNNGQGSNDSPQNNVVSTGNSGGIGSTRTNQWLHLAVIKQTGGTVKLMRNGGRAQNNSGNTGYSQINNNDTFGSGDPELEALRFGYVGRSVLAGSGATGDVVNGTPNAWIYGFKVYSKAAPVTGTNDDLAGPPTQAELRTTKGTMNAAFGFSNTD